MFGRFLRWVAVLALAILLPWEIAAEPPLLVLLIALVAACGLAIDAFVNLPRELHDRRASREMRERGERTGLIPVVPWGLDLVSVMAGLTVGLATNWWIGIATWIVVWSAPALSDTLI